jgi:NAD(P)-dependent dehydrogenase (short-subunit alcohol dehydrogenase family)
MNPLRRAVDALAELSVVGSYSSIGYRLRAPTFAPLDVDLSGRSVVITGASSGIGEAAAHILAGRRANVLLLVRDAARGEAVARSLPPPARGDHLVVPVDLSDMEEVRRAAAQVRTRVSRLHALVNNAGVLLDRLERTPQGLERAFATNVVGGFLLSHLLLGELAASGRPGDPARLVHVSSGGMYTQRLDLALLQGNVARYEGLVAYAQHKRAQVILNRRWVDRLCGLPVESYAMHPGWARTKAVATSLPRFDRVMGPILRDPAEGADTVAWLAASPEPVGLSGRFFLDRRPRAEHVLPWTRETPEEGRALWDLCVRLTGLNGPGPPAQVAARSASQGSTTPRNRPGASS